MTTKERETITALLARSGQEVKGGKTVTVFEFKKRPDDDYPTKVTWWPSQGSTAAPTLKLQQWYSVLFEKTPVPKRPDGSGGKGYFRDFVQASPVDAPEIAPVQAPAHAPPDQAGGERHPEAEMTRDESIQRQTALKAAVEFAGYQMQVTNEKVSTYHVAQIAGWFARFLEGNVHVTPLGKEPLEPEQAPTGADPADAETLFPPAPEQAPTPKTQARPLQAPAAGIAGPAIADAEPLLARLDWLEKRKMDWRIQFAFCTPAEKETRLEGLRKILGTGRKNPHAQDA